MLRLITVWDTLRESFWFIPAVFTALAIGLAAGLLAIDRSLPDGAPDMHWFYSGGAEGARSLLTAVAGSIVTVVALAFSITIVSLQLAAAQLGPRLLRNFVSDRGNQVVLGALVATFVYCLVVLRAVRGRDGVADGTFVPHLAITAGVALALVSVALLIYFVDHVSKAIQADRVIAAVGRDLDRAIDGLAPEATDGEEPAPVVHGDGPGATVAAATSAYVTGIDRAALVRLARDRGATFRLDRRPGDFVIAGEPLARVLPSGRLDGALAEAIAEAFVLGRERTPTRDVLFGIEQLVEIAARALASGYADPHTAVRCIDRLGAAVARLAGRPLPSPWTRDEAGVVRLVERPLTIADVVGAAFAPMRRHGAGNCAVALRLLETFDRLTALRASRELHGVLFAEAVRVDSAARRILEDADDRAAIRAVFERLAGRLRADVAMASDSTATAPGARWPRAAADRQPGAAAQGAGASGPRRSGNSCNESVPTTS